MKNLKKMSVKKKDKIRKLSTQKAIEKLLKKIIELKRNDSNLGDKRLLYFIKNESERAYEAIVDFLEKPTMKKIEGFKIYNIYYSMTIEGLMLLYYKENK